MAHRLASSQSAHDGDPRREGMNSVQGEHPLYEAFVGEQSLEQRTRRSLLFFRLVRVGPFGAVDAWAFACALMIGRAYPDLPDGLREMAIPGYRGDVPIAGVASAETPPTHALALTEFTYGRLAEASLSSYRNVQGVAPDDVLDLLLWLRYFVSVSENGAQPEAATKTIGELRHVFWQRAGHPGAGSTREDVEARPSVLYPVLLLHTVIGLVMGARHREEVGGILSSTFQRKLERREGEVSAVGELVTDGERYGVAVERDTTWSVVDWNRPLFDLLVVHGVGPEELAGRGLERVEPGRMRDFRAFLYANYPHLAGQF